MTSATASVPPDAEQASTVTPENKDDTPETTLSLTHNEDEVVSDLDVSPTPKEEGEETSVRAEPNDDDSSSADDSSYFADPSHLPKPKSRYPHQHQRQPGRQSDASLSFSDDSDAAGGGVPEVYPQRLTRVHSYNSLVSTTSSQHSSEQPARHPFLLTSSNDLVYSGESSGQQLGGMLQLGGDSPGKSSPGGGGDGRKEAPSNPFGNRALPSELRRAGSAPDREPSASTLLSAGGGKGYKVYWQRWIMLMVRGVHVTGPLLMCRLVLLNCYTFSVLVHVPFESLVGLDLLLRGPYRSLDRRSLWPYQRRTAGGCISRGQCCGHRL